MIVKISGILPLLILTLFLIPTVGAIDDEDMGRIVEELSSKLLVRDLEDNAELEISLLYLTENLIDLYYADDPITKGVVKKFAQEGICFLVVAFPYKDSLFFPKRMEIGQGNLQYKVKETLAISERFEGIIPKGDITQGLVRFSSEIDLTKPFKVYYKRSSTTFSLPKRYIAKISSEEELESEEFYRLYVEVALSQNNSKEALQYYEKLIQARGRDDLELLSRICSTFLSELSDKDNMEYALSAASLLSRKGIREGTITLKEILLKYDGSDKWSSLLPSLASALEVLGDSEDISVIPILRRIMQDRDEDIFLRLRAAQSLAKLGDSSGSTFLRSLLNSEEDEVRYGAAIALGELGEEDVLQLVVESILRAGEVSARREWRGGFSSAKAVELLGRMAPKSAIPLLRRVLRSGDTEIRAAAVETLGKLRDRALIPLLKESLKDDDLHVRISAAEALLGMGDNSGAPILKSALTSEGIKNKAKAVELLGRIGDDSGIIFLKASLREGYMEDKIRAAEALLTTISSLQNIREYIQMVKEEFAGELSLYDEWEQILEFTDIDSNGRADVSIRFREITDCEGIYTILAIFEEQTLGHYREVLSVADYGLEIYSARDLTRDGVNELIIARNTGGNCFGCASVKIYHRDKEGRFEEVIDIPAESPGEAIVDLNNDGFYEIIVLQDFGDPGLDLPNYKYIYPPAIYMWIRDHYMRVNEMFGRYYDNIIQSRYSEVINGKGLDPKGLYTPTVVNELLDYTWILLLYCQKGRLEEGLDIYDRLTKPKDLVNEHLRLKVQQCRQAVINFCQTKTF